MIVDIAIWQALDVAETSGIAATLSGLSITASSFLANLVKTHSDKAAAAKDVWDTAEKAANSDPKNKSRRDVADLERKAYEGLKAIAEDAARAMKMLLSAFALFTIDLVESLTFDPIVDKETLAGGLRIAGYTYEQLVPFDVGFAGFTLAGGVILLGMSARAIFKIIPKID